MKKGIVWKVVENRGGRLISAIMKHPYMVEYAPGEWIEGEAGPLFAFDNPQDAQDWIGDDDKYAEIWECEAEEIRRPDSALCTVSMYCVEPKDVKEWWNGHLALEAEAGCLSGTVVCERIKLIRRIWKWNSSTDSWTNGRSVTTPELSKQ